MGTIPTSTTKDLIQSNGDPRKDLFFCEPYECHLLVGACVARQALLASAATGKKIRRGIGYVSSTTLQTKFEKCINCVVGQANTIRCAAVVPQPPKLSESILQSAAMAILTSIRTAMQAA